VLIAEDENGAAHAGVLIVWDAESCFYLMGGGDPTLRSSGASSLCVWEAIRHASTVSREFDFEGSMIEPIERFFRGFGAVQRSYFLVRRIDSTVLSIAHALRNRWRAFFLSDTATTADHASNEPSAPSRPFPQRGSNNPLR